MSRVSEWLVELDAHNGTEVVTLRFSGGGYMTSASDTPPNAMFLDRIEQSAGLSVVARHLYGDGRTFNQDSSIEPGALVLSNADGALDYLRSYAFDGRTFRLYRLDSYTTPFSQAELVLTGTMEGPDFGSGYESIRIPFYDRRRDIDVDLQTEKYAGTTITAGATAEGSADMKDTLKPIILGKCFNVPAIVVNDFNIFLQFSTTPLESVLLYDGGVPLIDDGDVADLDELLAAEGNPGHYVTCLSLGLAKPFGMFNGRPAYVWTADIVEGATAADRTASGIVRRMLQRIGITTPNGIDADSFDDFAALAPAELGIYFDTEISVLQAASDILRSVGGYLIPNEFGQFIIGRLELPSGSIGVIHPDIILTSSKNDSIGIIMNPDTEGYVPTDAIVVKWGKYWHTHSDSDIGHCANHGDPTRGSSLKLEWREARVEDPGVKSLHPLTKEIEIQSYFTAAEDAEEEAERVLEMYGVSRDTLRITLTARDARNFKLDVTLSVYLDRFNYVNGKNMRVIGRIDDFQNEVVTLILWG